MLRYFVFLFIFLYGLAFGIEGNTYNQSFSKAKKIMQHKIYTGELAKTLYCNANIRPNSKQLTPPNGFSSTKYIKRSYRWEAEHIVPAENFGRTFSSWRNGSPICVSKRGKAYKGRRCANKASKEYRYMQADLYNLYPAIGSVNAAHSNLRWGVLTSSDSSFGTCDFKYSRALRIAMPPKNSRGIIARAALYMAAAYPAYNLSPAQEKLFKAWNKLNPVTKLDCLRAAKIKAIQGNINPFIEEQCKQLK